MQQMALDARWDKKNGDSPFCYKNSICADVLHGFICRYAGTPTNIHDIQMLSSLLDPKNEHYGVWADFAYSGQCFQNLLGHAGFESLIHENGTLNHPLNF
jgi:IS5 family transposase